jgi:hypothetical protein
MKVDKHISELLYEHDCVIVPEFGGFIANYAPAKIHPTQHTFIPPSKNISFNKHLKSNDGLLANHIAISEKTSYPEALKHINTFSITTNAQLKQGQKVRIEEVGSLFLDTEKNIQFEPETTNYLLDAFGLTQFQSPAIKRDTITKRIEKEFTDRTPVVAVQSNKVKIKRYVALAITVPVIASMIWLSVKTDVFKNVNYSSLNPFSIKVKEAVDYSKKTATQTKELTATDVKPIAIVVAKDTLNNTHLSTSQPVTASLLENKEIGIVKADSTKVERANLPVSPELKFHLVTGCFQVPENADRFVNTLQDQNISASIIGKRNGLLVVSSGNFATKEEAMAQLLVLKKSQPEAWLLVK